MSTVALAIAVSGVGTSVWPPPANAPDRARPVDTSVVVTTTTTSLPPPPASVAPTMKIATTDPVVFLTIDDGWTRSPEALALIRERRIPATLFILPAPAAADPAYYRDMAQWGSIENHSSRHDHQTKKPAAAQVDDICAASDSLAAIFGRRPLMFRPPGGLRNADVDVAVGHCGMYANMLWSATVNDGKLTLNSPRPTLEPGDIILAHFRPSLPDDIRAVIAAADAAGLRFASLENYVFEGRGD